jgi:hypothetical protein
MLKQNGVKLDWVAIDAALREISRNANDIRMLNKASASLAKRYRSMCLKQGLLKPGEMFNWKRDCDPLIGSLGEFRLI